MYPCSYKELLFTPLNGFMSTLYKKNHNIGLNSVGDEFKLFSCFSYCRNWYMDILCIRKLCLYAYIWICYIKNLCTNSSLLNIDDRPPKFYIFMLPSVYDSSHCYRLTKIFFWLTFKFLCVWYGMISHF